MPNDDTLLRHATLVAAAAYAEDILRRGAAATEEQKFLAQIVLDKIPKNQIQESVHYLRWAFQKREKL